MKMNMIKKIAAGLAIAMSLVGPAASEDGVAWDRAPNKITDMVALQNGAKTFSAYCLGCHGAEYMRYNRLEDIGFTLDEIKNEIVKTDAKVGDTMRSVISPKEGKEWFGVPPPDLSVIARSRAGANGSGADYLYTYLRSFYRDPTSPTGFNNVVFLNTGMPNVFWEQQGDRKAVFEQVVADGQSSDHFKGFQQMMPGSMNPEQFDQMVGDLVNYLQWMGEPVQNQRKTMGIYVLIFLAGFIVVAWRLNKSYWKDIK